MILDRSEAKQLAICTRMSKWNLFKLWREFFSEFTNFGQSELSHLKKEAQALQKQIEALQADRKLAASQEQQLLSHLKDMQQRKVASDRKMRHAMDETLKSVDTQAEKMIQALKRANETQLQRQAEGLMRSTKLKQGNLERAVDLQKEMKRRKTVPPHPSSIAKPERSESTGPSEIEVELRAELTSSAEELNKASTDFVQDKAPNAHLSQDNSNDASVPTTSSTEDSQPAGFVLIHEDEQVQAPDSGKIDNRIEGQTTKIPFPGNKPHDHREQAVHKPKDPNTIYL